MARKNEFRSLSHLALEAGAWTADIDKAREALAAAIVNAIIEKWGSAIAAERGTGIAHEEFSRIRNGNLARYSLDRLAHLLLILNPDLEARVEVKIKRRHLKDGKRMPARRSCETRPR